MLHRGRRRCGREGPDRGNRVTRGNRVSSHLNRPGEGGSVDHVLLTFLEKLAKFGVDPMVMTPSEFDEFVRAEISSNEVVIKFLR